MENLLKEGWRLDRLEIQFNAYGEFKDKYTGKIRFQNSESEAFMFNLRPDQAEEYLRIIKKELSGAANQLGDKLLQSLNLLPAAPEKKLIGEEIAHEPVTY